VKRLTKLYRDRIALLADCDHLRLSCKEVGCLVGGAVAVIDSQAAEIRDLKARLKAIDKSFPYSLTSMPDFRITKAALDLRKPFKPEGET
jgi:hypothetical protein